MGAHPAGAATVHRGAPVVITDTATAPAPGASAPDARVRGEAGVVRVLDALRLTRSRVSVFRVRMEGLPSADGAAAVVAVLGEAGVAEAITADQAVVLVIDAVDHDLAEARVAGAVRRFLAGAGPRGAAIRAEVAALHRSAGQIEDAEELLLALAAAPAGIVPPAAGG
jgi:hypothetical protein